jgi:osmoprotectant transport system permease protein
MPMPADGAVASPGRNGFSSAVVWRRVLIAIVIVALLIWWIGPATFANYREELLFDLGAHLQLVGWSMLAAVLTGVPSGILLSRPSVVKYAERLMQIFNVGNTIPSLAVLVLALAVLGIGDGPALMALWLASVLPITRNTYEGLRQVPMSLREAAKGIGMTKRQSLFQVELPNALPMIFGGFRTALAVNVGTAPLAFLIGADSLGTLIFPGIYLNNQPQLLLGAAATAVLALGLDAIVAAIARAVLLSRGLSQQAGA